MLERRSPVAIGIGVFANRSQFYAESNPSVKDTLSLSPSIQHTYTALSPGSKLKLLFLQHGEGQV
jgi:hypothetical protein